MGDIEGLLAMLQTLYANLGLLRLMEGPEMLLPGRVQNYRQTRETAIFAYEKIETIIGELGAATSSPG